MKFETSEPRLYNFRDSTNMFKIKSRGFDRAQYCNVNECSKHIANSFAKIMGIKANSKPCETSEVELFPRSCYWL